MSKISQLAQSLSSALAIAKDSKTKPTQSAANAQKKSGLQLLKQEKPQDSLGNPNSPGYDLFRDATGGGGQGEKKDGSTAAQDSAVVIQPKSSSSQELRLNFGWEKVLLAQKKICQKTIALLTKLQGPERYQTNRKAGAANRKTRGCIIDIDLEELREKQEIEEKTRKAKGKSEDEAA